MGEGWIAAGDAALSFDPLLSHGLLNALHTGARAAAAVHAWLSGNRDGVTPYAEHVAAIYAAYLAHLRAYYGSERRWADRPLWSRRHGMRESAPMALQ